MARLGLVSLEERSRERRAVLRALEMAARVSVNEEVLGGALGLCGHVELRLLPVVVQQLDLRRPEAPPEAHRLEVSAGHLRR